MKGTKAMHSSGATVHGMDGSLVQPDWSPLKEAELRRLFDHFEDLSGEIQILSTSPRPFSAASVVSVGEERAFVKRHDRRIRDCASLQEEHAFIQHLRQRGAAVPKVLAARDSATAIAIGDSTYEVHELPPGIDAYGDAVSWTPFRSAQHARSAGQQLARLHLASEGFAAPARGVRPLISSFTIFAAKDPVSAMADYVSARPSLNENTEVRRDCTLALELLAPYWSELNPLMPHLMPLWTHNDLHASNLFWSDASESAHATAVIDFGLADRTNAVHDLALAIERNTVEWLHLAPAREDKAEIPIHVDHVFALLEGYHSIRPLTDKERVALAPMTALCHAEFALSEADYFLGVLHSTEKARLAHDGYLVGHARWFRGRQGSTSLEAIRAWASGRRVPVRQEAAQA